MHVIFADRYITKIIKKKSGDPRRIRTSDPQIRNLMLYPAELWNLYKKNREEICNTILYKRQARIDWRVIHLEKT